MSQNCLLMYAGYVVALVRSNATVVNEDVEALSIVTVSVDTKIWVLRSTLITVNLLLTITMKCLDVRSIVLKRPS